MIEFKRKIPRKLKKRGKPFAKGSDERRNVDGKPKKASEANFEFNQHFIGEMFREVQASIDGKPIIAPRYQLFIKQMIEAGIKGNTSARKLVMEFMSKLETKEEVDEAKRESEGEDASAFSWDAAKEQLYQDMKAAGR